MILLSRLSSSQNLSSLLPPGKALQEIFLYFARSDTSFCFPATKKPVWISAYQWQLFCNSFHLAEVTGFTPQELLTQFGPKQEPIDFLAFLDLLTDVAVAYINRLNYPLTISDLNVVGAHSDRLAALYRFAEVWNLHDDITAPYKRYLRGRERIRGHEEKDPKAPTTIGGGSPQDFTPTDDQNQQ